MSDAIIIALIAAVPGVLMTLGSLYSIGRRVEKVHVLVNSQKDALMALLAGEIAKVSQLQHQVEQLKAHEAWTVSDRPLLHDGGPREAA